MVRKFKLNMGFTLVELLIVITLIAVLAVALVATLNPIEQINRARDSRYKNDAAELLGAIERYYTSTGEYPWMDATVDGTSLTIEEVYAAQGTYAGVGVCADNATPGYSAPGDCGADGVLITSDELKSQFRNKEQFKTGVTFLNQLYVYKPQGSSSVYVCFIPIANVNHKPSERVRLWNLGITVDGHGNGIPSSITEVASDGYTEPTWEDAVSSYFICVPE